MIKEIIDDFICLDHFCTSWKKFQPHKLRSIHCLLCWNLYFNLSQQNFHSHFLMDKTICFQILMNGLATGFPIKICCQNICLSCNHTFQYMLYMKCINKRVPKIMFCTSSYFISYSYKSLYFIIDPAYILVYVMNTNNIQNRSEEESLKLLKYITTEFKFNTW
jgi:hypothetical protein